MTGFESRLDSLRRRYLERLASEMPQMEALAAGDPSAENLEALRQMAHKLAGISGSLGYPAVSRAALRLDRSWSTAEADLGALRAALRDFRAVTEECLQAAS